MSKLLPCIEKAMNLISKIIFKLIWIVAGNWNKNKIDLFSLFMQ